MYRYHSIGLLYIHLCHQCTTPHQQDWRNHIIHRNIRKWAKLFEDGIIHSMTVRSRQIENQLPLSWLVFFRNDTKRAVLKKRKNRWVSYVHSSTKLHLLCKITVYYLWILCCWQFTDWWKMTLAGRANGNQNQHENLHSYPSEDIPSTEGPEDLLKPLLTASLSVERWSQWVELAE